MTTKAEFDAIVQEELEKMLAKYPDNKFAQMSILNGMARHNDQPAPFDPNRWVETGNAKPYPPGWRGWLLKKLGR